MKLSDLFALLFGVTEDDDRTGGGRFLLTLTDASVKKDFRGPGKNKFYGPFGKKDMPAEKREQSDADRRQRMFNDAKNITVKLARFWSTHFDREGFYEFVQRRIEFGRTKDIGAILEANGYPGKRDVVIDTLQDLLLTGLDNRTHKIYEINGRPWNSSLYDATLPDKTEIPTKKRFSELRADEIFVVGNQYLSVGGYEVQLPKQSKIPAGIKPSERKYIKALYEVYSEYTGEDVDITYIETHPDEEWVEVFNDHRREYFDADALRNLLNEASLDGEEEFEKIKADIYEAIKATIRKRFDTGYDRLQETMTRIGEAKLMASHVTTTSGLFKITHRKGVCHILVNAGRFKWVKP